MEAREFEIIFATEPLTDHADERIDRAIDAIPGTVVASYGELTLVTTIVTATSAVEAGLSAAATLKDAGIDVVRTYPDLVSRQDIADRTAVTRQAVGNWVRGERHYGNFPTPSVWFRAGRGFGMTSSSGCASTTMRSSRRSTPHLTSTTVST